MQAPSTSAPPQASMPASKAAPQATDDDDHAHMLHPVNTSSHFDTGAALLVAPEKPLATLETEKPAPAEAKAKAPNAKPQVRSRLATVFCD